MISLYGFVRYFQNFDFCHNLTTEPSTGEVFLVGVCLVTLFWEIPACLVKLKREAPLNFFLQLSGSGCDKFCYYWQILRRKYFMEITKKSNFQTRIKNASNELVFFNLHERLAVNGWFVVAVKRIGRVTLRLEYLLQTRTIWWETVSACL